MHAYPRLGHNDLVPHTRRALADEIAAWAEKLDVAPSG